MKLRIISTLLLAVFVFGQSGRLVAASKIAEAIQSEQSDVIVDESYEELSSLDQLEQELLANENLTIEDIDLEAYNLNYDDYEETFASTMGVKEAPLGIPSFLWGLVLGWVGILIVFLMNDGEDDKKEQVKKAVIGCAVQGAVALVLWVVLVAVTVDEANDIANSL